MLIATFADLLWLFQQQQLLLLLLSLLSLLLPL